MKFVGNIPVFGVPISNAMDQIRRCAVKAEKVALMADHHQGYSCPIGGVVAYDNQVSPQIVGYDIACGNKAVKTDMKLSDFNPKIANDMWNALSFGVGQVNDERVDHELFDNDLWKTSDLLSNQSMYDNSRNQLGTIGSGNHYVNIFADEDDYIWVGCHFGSRGLGHKTASHFMKLLGASDGIDADPCVVGLDTDLGKDYWQHMELAGNYAYAGRDWVCDKIVSILGAKIIDSVHNHHNFAWKETHRGIDLVVGRKGATPAFPGQRGFVGSSMGEDSVILVGVKNKKSFYSMSSTVHGAGRAMSRAKAAKGVILMGGGCDESPHAYKRLDSVLESHKGTVAIEHTLRPLVVCMAADGTVDPYKD
jgi:tRNA-splicing ligase RtcB